MDLNFKDMKVLVIEDDKRIASLVERGLRENGHRVSVSHNGREGAEMMLGGNFRRDLPWPDYALFGQNMVHFVR